MVKQIDYDAFIAKLRGAKSFIIASHYNPDGDGIGSTLALGEALRKMDKRVVMYNRDGVPFNLKFLPGSSGVVDKIDPNFLFDIGLMVDCAQRKRISDEFAAMKNVGSVVCIDHHLLENAEADLLLIDKDAASTGEVVLHLMEHAGVKISKSIAQCIYTTLVVDTGFFKYSNTSAHTLRVAGGLVDAGASPWDVAKYLDESHPASGLKLLALSLATLDIDCDGEYATMDLTREMLDRSGAMMEYSEEFASYPRSIEGVEVSALFREVEDNLVKISLRSKDYVDVAAIAKSFGGGGHSHAAGFRIRCSMEEAKSKLRDEVKKLL